MTERDGVVEGRRHRDGIRENRAVHVFPVVDETRSLERRGREAVDDEDVVPHLESELVARDVIRSRERTEVRPDAGDADSIFGSLGEIEGKNHAGDLALAHVLVDVVVS